MTDSTPARRSGRQRVPTQKLKDDVFETLKLVLSSDSEDEEILQQQLLVEDDSDDFPENQVAEDLDDEDEDESLAEDSPDGSEILTPVEVYEDAHSYASTDSASPGVPQAARRKPIERNVHKDVNVHSRGMPENPLKQDYTRSIIKLFSGEGEKDIFHIVKAKDQWAADPTLPKRRNMRHGISYTDDQRQMEATIGWDWYYDQGGRETFTTRQNVQNLTVDEAQPYSQITRHGDQEFVIGPYEKQKRYSLAPAQTLGLDEAWRTPEDQEPHPKRRRHGWILNVGTCVKCLDWAPIQDGNVQYLAVATAKTANSPRSSTSDPPAFTPLPAPSVLQLWTFPTLGSQENIERPYVHSHLCSDWGETKQLKWCPVPRKARSSPSDAHIGLLAVICGDGHTRVLDIRIDPNQGLGTFAKYHGSGFAAPPPAGNVSTCLAWLSSTDLAIGYSNGHLAIYDICPSARSIPSDTADRNVPRESSTIHQEEPVPWLSMPLHTTYIMSLSSAYPTHPALLTSISLAGYLRLTSLVAPKTDYVLSARTRSPPTSLAYCDSLMSVVGTEESSETIKLWGLRCFYASFQCAKLPAPPGPGNGTVDAGRCHSTIATGSADGSVMVTNPMRKVLGRKQSGYQQCIFKHEWRPATTVQTSEENLGRRRGLSRITEGYKAEKVNLLLRNNFGKTNETAPITTIYEEETAVTALAWNSNLPYGGWLAVGWGSGLVRVQDVAID